MAGKFHYLGSASLAVSLAAGLVVPAHAQRQNDKQDTLQLEASEPTLVTGTRIQRDTIDTATLIVQLDSEELDDDIGPFSPDGDVETGRRANFNRNYDVRGRRLILSLEARF